MHGIIAIFNIKSNEKQDKKNNSIAITKPVLNEIIDQKWEKRI
ncbi:hypothetical protein ACRRVD_02200 [Candidatus Cardinium hertigii]